jgi:hypothetical protein
MALLLEHLDEETRVGELADLGSFNHGYLQLKIGACFLQLPQFTPSSELSLDLSALANMNLGDLPDLLKPDIAVYAEWPIDFQNDVLQSRANACVGD